jgi:tRNA G46 methylase TrmB
VCRGQVVRLAAAATTRGGRLHIATDVEEYARWCVRVMTPMLVEGGGCHEEENNDGEMADWRDCNGPDGWLVERPEWRPLTKYERRGVEELNHRIYDLLYERT